MLLRTSVNVCCSACIATLYLCVALVDRLRACRADDIASSIGVVGDGLGMLFCKVWYIGHTY